MYRVQVDHRAAVTVQPQRNRVLDEHFFHGLEIELRRQVHHREIFVVEVAVSFGAIAVAFHEMVEHLEMRGDVAFDVHGHEARQLQKAGIDLAPMPGLGKGTLWMQCCLNQPMPRSCARRLTIVGFTRGSIGPPSTPSIPACADRPWPPSRRWRK